MQFHITNIRYYYSIQLQYNLGNGSQDSVPGKARLNSLFTVGATETNSLQRVSIWDHYVTGWRTRRTRNPKGHRMTEQRTLRREKKQTRGDSLGSVRQWLVERDLCSSVLASWLLWVRWIQMISLVTFGDPSLCNENPLHLALTHKELQSRVATHNMF